MSVAVADRATLDAALLMAHEIGDRAALVALYTQAAEDAGGTAAAFYLTHAYVFALDVGADAAPILRARLIEMGAEVAVT